jgi:2-polyprenyl-6-methoxyphenol hydroxylase-like FAD-dependent oxidoreductase
VVKGSVNAGAREHAVVVGASMAGLLAARVLADHFGRVTVLDRDVLPDVVGPRKGVPQARHVHVLLASGRAAMVDLVPGLESDLERAGAPLVDPGTQAAWRGPFGWLKQPGPSDLLTRCVSRDLLEHLVRQRVRAHPRVSILSATKVVGLLGADGGERVAGVRLATGEPLAANLVIDASGRASHLPDWVVELGHLPPEEIVVEPHAGYATGIFTGIVLPPPLSILFMPAHAPDQPRGGAIFPLEGNRHIVTLYGVGRDVPPTEPRAWQAFAASLSSPAIATALASAQLVGTLHATRTTASRRRLWEERKLPVGVVPIGDAVAAFNPVYGQGMTVAALEARALAALLAEAGPGELDEVCRELPRRCARIVQTPWTLATSEDLRFATTDGDRPPWLGMVARANDALMSLCTRDGAATLAFARVAHLAAPPSTLAAPRLAAMIAVHAAHLAGPDPRMRSPELPSIG